MTDTTEAIWKRLSEPFPEDRIKAYPQTLYLPNRGGKATEKPYPAGTSGKVLEYVDARAVMDRLDDVVGPENWHDEYYVLSQNPWAVECRLTLVIGDKQVTHADVGYSNDPGSSREAEPAKAAYSDSLKRCAVKFGPGRFLYSRPDLGYIEVDKYGTILLGSLLAAKIRAKLITTEQMESILAGEPLASEPEDAPRSDSKAAGDTNMGSDAPTPAQQWAAVVKDYKTDPDRKAAVMAALGEPPNAKAALDAFSALSQTQRDAIAFVAKNGGSIG